MVNNGTGQMLKTFSVYKTGHRDRADLKSTSKLTPTETVSYFDVIRNTGKPRVESVGTSEKFYYVSYLYLGKNLTVRSPLGRVLVDG